MRARPLTQRGTRRRTGPVAERARNAERLHLPPLYALDDVIASFTGVGFEAAVARLKVRFIPASSHVTSFRAGLDYFYDHKVVLRFARD